MARAASSKTKRQGAPADLPSEQDILDFVNSTPGKVGKREIARAFDVKGTQRSELKRLLRSMAERGLIAAKHRKLTDPRSLPPIGVIEVTGQDSDGELIAVPLNWDTEVAGPAPVIVVDVSMARGARDDKQPPKAGERILARLGKTDDPDYPYRAELIRRLRGGPSRMLGVYRRSKDGGARIVTVDKRQRDELQVRPGDDGGAKPDELVEVEIKRDRGRGLVFARVVKRLGDVSSPKNVADIAIQEHNIRTVFSDAVMGQTKALSGKLDLNGRTDLRDVPLVTIDPEDARDHDDAVWAAPDDDPANAGGFKVIVAIADVAHYVQAGTPLDAEARLRGNSVYLPDRVVPMLPERISNDLCSLREGEDRPALACLMTFDRNGEKRDHRMERAVIRSAAKLSYQQAQAAIDGRPDDKTGVLLPTVLEPLWSAYRCLQQARARREPLDLDLPERRLVLDEEGRVERVVVPPRLDAHKLIEEMMIQANVSAAELLEKKRAPVVYRAHDAPSDEKLKALAEFLKSAGLPFPRGQVMRPRHFNQILAKARGGKFEHVINDVILRSQAQAVYKIENAGHFGLNLRRYAHFTSPIRRYADLLVHRSLISTFDLGTGGLPDSSLENLAATAEQISLAERRAMAAERDTVDRLVAAHMASKIRSRFTARISGAARAGLFVSLEEAGAEGFIPAASLEGDYFVHDEIRHALVGERSGETFQLGDRVEVRLLEAAPLSGGLRFEMLSTGKRGKPMTRRPQGRYRGKGRRR